MAEKLVKFVCPYCKQEVDSLNSLKSHIETAHPPEAQMPVWGREIYPPPKGVAFIETNDLKCVGCGLCAEACSMQHYGVINKSFARIYIRKVLLPLPKAIAVSCSQCQDQERPCEKACPVEPAAIHFDKKSLHMIVNQETCIGCMSCQQACGSEAIRFVPELSESPLVCDLCDTKNTGERNPQCVQICPVNALYYHNREERVRPIRDTFRRNSEEKANLISKRLYPLTRESVAFPAWKAETKIKNDE